MDPFEKLSYNINNEKVRELFFGGSNLVIMSGELNLGEGYQWNVRQVKFGGRVPVKCPTS